MVATRSTAAPRGSIHSLSKHILTTRSRVKARAVLGKKPIEAAKKATKIGKKTKVWKRTIITGSKKIQMRPGKAGVSVRVIETRSKTTTAKYTKYVQPTGIAQDAAECLPPRPRRFIRRPLRYTMEQVNDILEKHVEPEINRRRLVPATPSIQQSRPQSQRRLKRTIESVNTIFKTKVLPARKPLGIKEAAAIVCNSNTLNLTPRAAPLPAFTFGVELEVLFHFDPSPYRSRLPPTFKAADTTLLAAALSSPRYEHLLRADVADYLRTLNLSVNPIFGTEDTSAWSVATDHTILTQAEFASHDGTRAVIGIEIKTPCLPFTPASLALLKRVMSALRRHFTVTENPSTELHVHVGLASPCTGVQIPYTLQTVKQLAMLMALHEQVLHELASPTLRADEYCKPLSVILGPAAAAPGQIVALVRGARDIPAFCKLMGWHTDDRHYSVNFQNLAADAKFGTVEFRQHAGCFDAERVAMRVRLVVGMVRWALKARGVPTWQVRDLRELLVRLGVEEDVVRYWAKKAVY